MVLGAIADLFHKHVDVSLGSIQDIAMWMRQTPHSDLHGLPINVNPTRCSTGQKSPLKSHKNQQE